ncbi:MAG: hypothetical protein DRN78_03855 [Thermoproteota archaeon]|nr:MAG: hypothetical protein DRN78_03855 [Candidatus Korarchaeota archaeon]
MRFYLETHGCAMNRSDSQIIESILRRAGWDKVQEPEEADVLILNTCNVKTPTEQRMVHRAKVLSSYGPLVAAGCMAVSQPELLRPYSKVLVGPRAINNILEAVKLAYNGKKGEFLENEAIDKAALDREPQGLIGIVPIAEGCLGSCTYCITRIARGRLTSFPPESILKRVRSFLEKGAIEIWLTGEDTGVYGLDLGTNLPSLLREVSSIEGEFRIRVGMMTPDSALKIKDDLLKAFKHDKIYKFFHIPVQSGSDHILKLMGRRYTAKQFIDLIGDIRRNFEWVSVSTDIIVGFPGETDEDFELTLKLLEIVEPDIVNLSKFGPRPKTPAALFKQLPRDLIKRRSKEAMKIIEEIKERRNSRYLGKEFIVLVSEKTEKGIQGRTSCYKPVALRKAELGFFYRVEIVDFRGNYLIGEITEKLGRAGLSIQCQVHS